MSAIPVELPQDLQDFVNTRVKHGQFSNASEYIVALVDSARKGRLALEAALIQGIESGPAEEWTKEEWDNLKERVSSRCRG